MSQGTRLKYRTIVTSTTRFGCLPTIATDQRRLQKNRRVVESLAPSFPSLLALPSTREARDDFSYRTTFFCCIVYTSQRGLQAELCLLALESSQPSPRPANAPSTALNAKCWV